MQLGVGRPSSQEVLASDCAQNCAHRAVPSLPGRHPQTGGRTALRLSCVRRRGLGKCAGASREQTGAPSRASEPCCAASCPRYLLRAIPGKRDSLGLSAAIGLHPECALGKAPLGGREFDVNGAIGARRDRGAIIGFGEFVGVHRSAGAHAGDRHRACPHVADRDAQRFGSAPLLISEVEANRRQRHPRVSARQRDRLLRCNRVIRDQD